MIDEAYKAPGESPSGLKVLAYILPPLYSSLWPRLRLLLLVRLRLLLYTNRTPIHFPSHHCSPPAVSVLLIDTNSMKHMATSKHHKRQSLTRLPVMLAEIKTRI